VKNKIIYMFIAVAVVVSGGIFVFNRFYSDGGLHPLNDLAAAKKEKPDSFIQPEAGVSTTNVEAAGGVDGREERLSNPGKQKPTQLDPAIRSGPVKDENEEEFEIDVNELKELFPDNLAVPSVSDEERRAKIKARQARNQAYGLIAANKATAEQIQAYYEQQSELAADSIEIIEFILDKYGGQLDERERAKQAFLLRQFQKRLEIIPKKEQQALQRLKAR
jgi:hypothetical protein